MIKLEEIAPYLPYGLKCQYEGILNGEEIGKWEKSINQVNFMDYDSYCEEHPRPREVIGIKTALLKEVKMYRNYWKACIGKYPGYLKKFINGHGFKPILRPMSEWRSIENGMQFLTPYTHSLADADGGLSGNINSIPYSDFIWFVSERFDVFNLIPRGLAIDINTIPPC